MPARRFVIFKLRIFPPSAFFSNFRCKQTSDLVSSGRGLRYVRKCCTLRYANHERRPASARFADRVDKRLAVCVSVCMCEGTFHRGCFQEVRQIQPTEGNRPSTPLPTGEGKKFQLVLRIGDHQVNELSYLYTVSPES